MACNKAMLMKLTRTQYMQWNSPGPNFNKTGRKRQKIW